MPPEATSLSEFITAESLCKHLGISKSVLARWRDRGLPYVRVGLKLYFREASVATWLMTQERTHEPLTRTPKRDPSPTPS